VRGDTCRNSEDGEEWGMGLVGEGNVSRVGRGKREGTNGRRRSAQWWRQKSGT